MKKTEREIYIILANEVDYSLCSFCKFSEVIYCGTVGCKHPLSDRLPEEVYEPGTDCWGFRPEYDIPTAADLVGIILANGWKIASWRTDDAGRLLISGAKE